MRWALLLFAACTNTREPSPDGFPIATDVPILPPRTDLLPAVGSESTLEIATWNIENFPANVQTPSVVADIIASLDLDIVVTEEIASETAWAELVQRLSATHDAVLSTHEYQPGEYQKLGVLYRRNLITAGEPTLLFPNDSFAFPRPPLALPITVDGHTIELVGVHLKAGPELESAERRQLAIQALDARFRAQIDGGGEDEIVLLGDYNEDVTSDFGRTVLSALLDAPDRYTVRTEPAAVAGGYSFIGFNSFIDHITTTAALDARWGSATVQVIDPRPEVSSYKNEVSDHLPVVLITPR